jgi:hypothetical protein
MVWRRNGLSGVKQGPPDDRPDQPVRHRRPAPRRGGGDAALFGDRVVVVQISVPSKPSDTGFTEAAAGQVFAAEEFETGRAVSIVETPSGQMSTRPTIFAALAKPLNMDNVVVAIQDQIGVIRFCCQNRQR